MHNVYIEKKSKLYEIIENTEIRVNSRHIRHIPSTKLDMVAYSEDGILEAVEDKTRRFFIGVQWHPESIIEDKYSNKLFDYFIKML